MTKIPTFIIQCAHCGNTFTHTDYDYVPVSKIEAGIEQIERAILADEFESCGWIIDEMKKTLLPPKQEKEKEKPDQQ